MGLEKALKELTNRLRQLADRAQELGLTVHEDQPAKDGAALVDKFEYATLDAQGWLDEALQFAKAAEKAAGHPLDIGRVRYQLAQSQDRFGRVEQTFSTSLFEYERLREVSAFAAEKRGGWPAWVASVKRGIDHCRQPLEESRGLMAECWQEIAERTGGTSVSVKTTNIGQKIEAHFQPNEELAHEESH